MFLWVCPNGCGCCLKRMLSDQLFSYPISAMTDVVGQAQQVVWTRGETMVRCVYLPNLFRFSFRSSFPLQIRLFELHLANGRGESIGGGSAASPGLVVTSKLIPCCFPRCRRGDHLAFLKWLLLCPGHVLTFNILEPRVQCVCMVKYFNTDLQLALSAVALSPKQARN